MNNKLGLIILDGWGIGNRSSSDAIYNANTPFMDQLWQKYPHATLCTHGESVGLPEGQMGNSEVGHMNIGAGRIVYQELTRINKSIREGDFFQNPTLLEAFTYAKKENKNIFFIGLLSKGGVHSSQEHLYALCQMAEEFDVNSYVFAFTDGRDCDPKSGIHFMQEFLNKKNCRNTKVSGIIGRYYAMDRDKRWERIKKAYDLMVNGIAEFSNNPLNVFENSYQNGITDEFIVPHLIIQENGEKVALNQGDVIISFNFRTDRPREITTVLTQQDFPEFGMKTIPLKFVSMTNYDDQFKNISVVFEKDNLSQTLGEVLANNQKTQLRIAETEKYPHVTFFFNGGREETFSGEERILVPSPKVATYDLQPEMSANEVKEKMLSFIEEKTPDFFCLNFANPDMVGHTGVYSAIQKAVETVDQCLKELVDKARTFHYELIIIADHGNADFALNEDGTPNTAHSMNPVPFILVTEDKLSLKSGILADMAPTILSRMKLPIPEKMSGQVLTSINEKA
ncbi:MAG: 2,3-bisphosphoglycerate-independent phosphoglycerate mutase [Flavobacteriia bacterium]|nr:2,3-bisphosphoglycerate-independent phosphoglycerate mutase [Flavobacteriia bacterium]